MTLVPVRERQDSLSSKVTGLRVQGCPEGTEEVERRFKKSKDEMQKAAKASDLRGHRHGYALGEAGLE